MKYCAACRQQNEDRAQFCSKCGAGEFSTTDPKLEQKRTRSVLNNLALRSGLALLVWVGVVTVGLVIASQHGRGLNSNVIKICVFAGTVVATVTFVSSRLPVVTRFEMAGLLIQLIIVGGIAAIVASGVSMFLGYER